jgi:hypothetical protein
MWLRSHLSFHTFCLSLPNRVLSELKVEHVKVTQLQRELEYANERSSGLTGTVVTSTTTTSSSSFSDSDVRKLQSEIRDKDVKIRQRDEELDGLRVFA